MLLISAAACLRDGVTRRRIRLNMGNRQLREPCKTHGRGIAALAKIQRI